jgi:hypothetical protein
VTEPLLRRLFAQIASTRKDVECTFGRIKNRFRMLKLPLQFDNLDDVRAMFVTCCVLHNMLLEHDREDVFNAEDGLHSEAIIGNVMCGFNFCLFDIHVHCVVSSSRRFSAHGVHADIDVTATLDVTGVGGQCFTLTVLLMLLSVRACARVFVCVSARLQLLDAA